MAVVDAALPCATLVLVTSVAGFGPTAAPDLGGLFDFDYGTVQLGEDCSGLAVVCDDNLVCCDDSTCHRRHPTLGESCKCGSGIQVCAGNLHCLNGICQGLQCGGENRQCACPTGKTAEPRAGYKAGYDANGCGAKHGIDFNIIIPDAVTPCCNAHDTCYGTFWSRTSGRGKQTCDDDQLACAKAKGYDSVGEIMHTVLEIGGDSAFDEAQAEAVSCV
mmetsp:Transcript_73321/g.122452  ORF Transcript_73321/g.122452 Transcript_73321/m.122452 type:complete len:218 (-) Transcript_73321:231-884(-)